MILIISWQGRPYREAMQRRRSRSRVGAAAKGKPETGPPDPYWCVYVCVCVCVCVRRHNPKMTPSPPAAAAAATAAASHTRAAGELGGTFTFLHPNTRSCNGSVLFPKPSIIHPALTYYLSHIFPNTCPRSSGGGYPILSSFSFCYDQHSRSGSSQLLLHADALPAEVTDPLKLFIFRLVRTR